MRTKFFPVTLSAKEQQMLSIVLDVELEMQQWFCVAFSSTLQEEFIVTIQ